MIPGRILRLVAALVFLVQDNHSQVFQRCKYRASGPQDNVYLAPPDPFPLVIALRHAQAAVKHHHPVPEIRGKSGHHLGRQCDLRHQNHALLPPTDHLLEKPDINGGFSAAGDSVEQGTGCLPLVQPGENPVIGRLLLPGENDRAALRRLRPGHPQNLHLGKRHQSAFLQALQCPHGCAGEVADIAGQRRAGRAQ